MINYYLQQDETTSITYNLGIVSELETGLPSMDYKLVNSIGEGSQINGYGTHQGRTIDCSYRFKTNSEYERNEFISWFTKASNINLYLYKEINQRIKVQLSSGSTEVFITSTDIIRGFSTGNSITGLGIPDNTIIDTFNTTSFFIDNAATLSIDYSDVFIKIFTGRTRVYPTPTGGESYKNDNVSNSVKFELFSESPFFTSTTLTTIYLNSTTTGQHTQTVTIKGQRTPAIYEFVSNEDFNIFQVKTAEDYGFSASYQFRSNSTITVDTRNSDLTIYYNGGEIFDTFTSNSSPFMLEQGDNTLYVYAANSTDGALRVEYYERRL